MAGLAWGKGEWPLVSYGCAMVTISAELIRSEDRAFFLEHGYLILERLIGPARLERAREALEARYALEGERGGWEQPGTHPNVRRLCNLFAKGDVFVDLAVEPVLLAFAELVIGREFRWQAMNAHDPRPGIRTRQALHADRQFFAGCQGYLNVIWALDDLTAENGATRLVPGSHRRPWPRAVLDNPLAPVEGEIQALAPAGSAILVHGDTWHGACDNNSAGTRRVLHLGYACPNTAPQYEISATLPESVRQRLGPLAEMLAPR